MVGYRPQEDVQLTTRDHAVAGATSGVISRVTAQPLDVLKVRFQLQIEPIRQNDSSKYWGIYHATKTIVREEGITALWKGHVPAQLLSVMYGVGQFVSFELLTKLVWKHLPAEYTTKYRPITHTICGGMAACMAISLAHPADLLRTRFIAQGSNKTYQSLFTGIKHIHQTEGLAGFYKGITPALIQSGCQMGLQFGLYSSFTSVWGWMEHRPIGQVSGMTQSALCGVWAGIISKLIVYPLDMTKKRLELRGVEYIRREFGSTRAYRGFLHCLVCVCREEGGRSMYKGLTPSLIKAGFMSASNFVIYEQVCRVIRLRHS